jgi:hypothetical protein
MVKIVNNFESKPEERFAFCHLKNHEFFRFVSQTHNAVNIKINSETYYSFTTDKSYWHDKFDVNENIVLLDVTISVDRERYYK